MDRTNQELEQISESGELCPGCEYCDCLAKECEHGNGTNEPPPFPRIVYDVMRGDDVFASFYLQDEACDFARTIPAEYVGHVQVFRSIVRRLNNGKWFHR